MALSRLLQCRIGSLTLTVALLIWLCLSISAKPFILFHIMLSTSFSCTVWRVQRMTVLIINNDHPWCLLYTTCSRWHHNIRILPIHCLTTGEPPLMASSPGPPGKGIRSAADNDLTVHSTLFFLKIVRIERKFHVIDRLCSIVSLLPGVNLSIRMAEFMLQTSYPSDG